MAEKIFCLDCYFTHGPWIKQVVPKILRVWKVFGSARTLSIQCVRGGRKMRVILFSNAASSFSPISLLFIKIPHLLLNYTVQMKYCCYSDGSSGGYLTSHLPPFLITRCFTFKRTAARMFYVSLLLLLLPVYILSLNIKKNTTFCWATFWMIIITLLLPVTSVLCALTH